MPNRLVDETSPYLKQHAENPVDWWPWGDEAFDEARRRDLPTLISIGYSSCHWCHVMAHESFEDPETAALMNSGFVNIKVDREERPDIDAVYMDAVQAMTGSGGWPMTIFATPDGKPFFGGTYFPPEPRHGTPGFRQILEAISQAWADDRGELDDQASRLTRAIQRDAIETRGVVTPEILEGAFESLWSLFDDTQGGFGGAPKFPQPMNLAFCLQICQTGDERALEIVETTLTKMALGGIYDQVGGGFARYSVDSSWLVPHFEKMLYDNAQLARLYLWAGVALGSDFFIRIATEILDYLSGEMRDDSGGFYSSTDADSEGVEGKFFVWQADQVRSLGGEVAADYFGVTEPGNFEGSNILTARTPLESLDSDAREQIVNARLRLYEARFERVHPGLDDKVVTAWNGLAISAFADAARVLGRGDYLETAVRCAEFVNQLPLRRSVRDGKGGVPAFADDHADLGLGCLALFEATGEWSWVARARELADALIERFADPADGLFFTTSRDDLVARPKDLFDNAEPSANSAGCELLLRLASLIGEDSYKALGEVVLERFAPLVGRAPTGFGSILSAMGRYLAPPVEVVVTGSGIEADRMRAEARRRYSPVLTLVSGVSGAPDSVPILAGKELGGDGITYVCENYACAAPARDLASANEALDNSGVFARIRQRGQKDNFE